MSVYTTLICETIPHDEATARVIEEVMRIQEPTLDHLTRPEFDALAALAFDAAVELAQEGLLDSICEGARLEVPPTFETCGDCEAAPGEPCHPDCSSNWV